MVAKEALLGRLLAVLHRTPSPPSFFLPSFVEEADMSIVANHVNNPSCNLRSFRCPSAAMRITLSTDCASPSANTPHALTLALQHAISINPFRIGRLGTDMLHPALHTRWEI